MPIQKSLAKQKLEISIKSQNFKWIFVEIPSRGSRKEKMQAISQEINRLINQKEGAKLIFTEYVKLGKIIGNDRSCTNRRQTLLAKRINRFLKGWENVIPWKPA